MSDADLGIVRSLIEVGVPIFFAERANDKGQWNPRGGHNGCGYWLPARWERTKADPAVLDRWRPSVAVCAVMGHVLDLLDVDPRNGGDLDKLVEALNGEMPITYATARTPSGGWHYFIRSLGLSSRDGLLPGIDLKAGVEGRGHGFAFIAPTVRAPKGEGDPVPYCWEATP